MVVIESAFALILVCIGLLFGGAFVWYAWLRLVRWLDHNFNIGG